jgi:predicted CopG family antitoxin
MNVITVRRTVFRSANKRSRGRRSFRELTRAYFARENNLEFVVEAVLCDNRGDLSLANPCSGRRITGIFPTRTDLIVEVDQLLLKTMEIAEGAS